MLITRKIGAILRGKATPFQLAAGCVLGALLGFLPGLGTAPGLTLGLMLLLVLLNANLFLAAIVGAAAKIVSLVALPLSFGVGRVLLEGPTEPLFQALVNAPVFALMGFDNYAAVGGLLVGAVFGAGVGAAVVKGVGRFRRRMADASEHSERYKKWNQKGWVRWSVFLLAGGGLKDPDYAALAQKKVGNPIRPLGAAFVVVSAVLIVVGAKFLAPQIVTTALRDGLEQANGATVNLDSVDLDLGAGRLEVTGLAMTDPNNLDRNVFAADRLEADVSAADLLRKRLTLDRVIISGAHLDQTRRIPGRRVSTAPEAEDAGPLIKLPDTGSIDDYLQNAEVWKERLAQVKSWLDRLGASKPTGSDESTGEGWADRIQRIAEERGYAAVQADHLVTDSPTLLVRILEADDMRASWLDNETLSLRGENLSTQPWLTETGPRITVNSSKDTTGLTLQAGRTTQLTAHYRGLSTDDVATSLQRNASDAPLLAGGTIDLAFDGTYDAIAGTIDLPLEVTLHDTQARVAGKAIPLDNFSLPIGLTGSLGSPRIKIDSNQLGRIAKQAGTQLIKDKAQEAIGEKAGGLLNGLLGGGKKKQDNGGDGDGE